jgi:hypothetical protein
MLKRGAIFLAQDVHSYFHRQVRANTQQMSIECRMVQTA